MIELLAQTSRQYVPPAWRTWTVQDWVILLTCMSGVVLPAIGALVRQCYQAKQIAQLHANQQSIAKGTNLLVVAHDNNQKTSNVPIDVAARIQTIANAETPGKKEALP
jgi:hypothetical protein